MVYMAGTKARVSKVEVTSPPINTTAAALSSAEPVSRPLTTGSNAKTTESVVIKMGRSRQLVRKSMVVVDEAHASRPVTTRYRFLETIRQYAEEKLLACGESEATRTSHADR